MTAAGWPGTPADDGALYDGVPLGGPFGDGPPAQAPPGQVEFDPVLLAADVAQALRDVASLTELIVGEQSGLLPKLEEHQEAIDAILSLLEAAPGGPWAWDKLTGAALRDLWLKLGEWVAWLEQRYLIALSSDTYELARCWWRHPIAVELLTALMVAHWATYSAKVQVPSFALVDWHTRAFEPVFATLKAMRVFNNCKDGHTDPTRSPKHDPATFVAWVDEVAPEVDEDDVEVADEREEEQL
ncbi:hypothetical protein [Cellulomonas sp. HD19AZ1]|uniref:hypothetical protein n=1 Tax=Cellulomonas sp. HD19AZ1 TaxID=2559593 RepID=UPI00107158D6|nr:hypothetical protein [Cellulomonas sp. HD19AZ1]TFH68157.1 hypothetical protein E4A51_18100 [Cellulomonas sp. HD19AZ1]